MKEVRNDYAHPNLVLPNSGGIQEEAIGHQFSKKIGDLLAHQRNSPVAEGSMVRCSEF